MKSEGRTIMRRIVWSGGALVLALVAEPAIGVAQTINDRIKVVE